MPESSLINEPFHRIASFYDKLMSSIPYIEWVDYIEQIMQSNALKPKSILDLACGTGTVSLLLRKRGYDVVGVDLSDAMLKVARKKAADAGLNIPFHCQDAAQLKLKEKFDLCVCLYDSLNYILDDDLLLAAFRGVRRSLQPGGIFLFDLNSLYSFQQELFTQESTTASPIGYCWQSHFNPVARVAEVQMHFDPPDGDPINIVHRQRAYLVDEVYTLLRQARFKVIQMYDAYSLLPPGRLSERIFYLVQKPTR